MDNEINEKEDNKNKTAERKGRLLFFVMSVVVVIQTAITFYLLAKSTSSNLVRYILYTLGAVYLVTFVLMTIFYLKDNNYKKQSGVNQYKKLLKVTKYLFKFLLIIISVISLFSAVRMESGRVFYFVIMVLINVFMIALDISVWSFMDEIKRKKQRKIMEENRKEY